MRKLTIVQKFLIWVIPSILVIIVISGIYLYITESRSYKKEIEHFTIEIVRARSGEISNMIDRIFSDLEQFAKRSDVQTMNFELIKPDLKAWQKEHSNLYNSFGLQYPNGDVYFTSGVILQSKNEDYYRAIFEEGKDRFITNPLKSKSTGELVFGVSVAIKNSKGKTIGAIDAVLPYSAITDIINSIKLGKESYSFIVNKDGLAIVHPNPEVLMKINISDSEKKGYIGLLEAGQGMQVNESGYNSIKRPDGVKEELIYCRIPNSPKWTLGVAIRTSEMYAKVEKILVTIALIFLLILITIIFVIFVSSQKIIVKPIKNVLKSVIKISKGDLTTKFTVRSNDELGILSENLNQMVSQLHEVINSVNTSSVVISTASSQVSSGAQQISQGANEQAASTEEISSTMEEISSSIEQNTNNAKITEQMSEKVQKGALDVNDNAKKTTEAQNIISDKIETINDIVFQTNILALNAAVEAARAGKHGKGFAVVATEVQKLAEHSKLAAEEIVNLSQNSKELAEKAGESLAKVIPQIEQTADLIKEITAASIEQNTGAEQINNSIQQLNQIAQQNAAASEELATTSETMNIQTQKLKDAISYFKID